MTPKEAIETIKIAEVEWIYPINFVIAFKTAIAALKKQIPKKPKSYVDTGDCFEYECPKCRMTYGRVTWRVKYCPNCGQALDWSNGGRKGNE